MDHMTIKDLFVNSFCMLVTKMNPMNKSISIDNIAFHLHLFQDHFEDGFILLFQVFLVSGVGRLSAQLEQHRVGTLSLSHWKVPTTNQE